MMMETPSTPDHALTAAEAAELRYLDPSTLHFFRHGATLRMIIEDHCCYAKVIVLRAFPLSHPQSYLSVRDGSNKEIGIIVDPAKLASECRRMVFEELERRYVVPVIQRIIAVKERFGTVDWEVETDFGHRKFTTRNLRENIVQPSPNRYVLSDVDGNRYDVRDLNALDPASQAWLMRHM